MLTGKTFLISGATGQIGSALCKRLETLGAQILPLVLPGYPRCPRRIHWEANTVPISVSGPEELRSLSRPDYVINLHWCVNRESSFVEQVIFETSTNLYSLEFLWAWLRDVAPTRFINVSTTKVYSFLNESPVSSRSEPHPVSPYGIAKLTGEYFFDAYFINGLPHVVHFRLGPVASFGEHPSKLMSRLFSSLLDGESITVYTGQYVCLLYIDEAVDFLINAAFSAQDRRYVVAGDRLLNEDLANRVEAYHGRGLNARYVNLEPRRSEPHLVTDNSSLYAPWMRRFTTEEWIEELYRIHRSQRDRTTI